MPSASQSLVVATYNVRLGIQEGLAAVADVLLATASPDIVAVQEVGRHWLMGPAGDSVSRLSELLDLPHSAYAVTIEESRPTGPPARYGHALFSRWPLDDLETVRLPRRDDEPRALLHCVVHAPVADLHVVSTHLSHRPSDRPDQGRFLCQWLDDQIGVGDTSFLLGDLNATTSTPWISSLVDVWVDADAHRNRPTFPAHAPERRIDYVLARNAALCSVTVADSPDAVDASDHRPVITRWNLPAT